MKREKMIELRARKERLLPSFAGSIVCSSTRRWEKSKMAISFVSLTFSPSICSLHVYYFLNLLSLHHLVILFVFLSFLVVGAASHSLSVSPLLHPPSPILLCARLCVCTHRLFVGKCYAVARWVHTHSHGGQHSTLVCLRRAICLPLFVFAIRQIFHLIATSF